MDLLDSAVMETAIPLPSHVVLDVSVDDGICVTNRPILARFWRY